MADEPYELTIADGVQVLRAKTARFRTDEADKVLSAVDPGEGEKPPRVLLNLHGVEFIDSGALSVIWRINERTSMRLAGLSPLVENTFRILGMLNILRHHPTEDEAMAAFKEHAG